MTSPTPNRIPIYSWPLLIASAFPRKTATSWAIACGIFLLRNGHARSASAFSPADMGVRSSSERVHTACTQTRPTCFSIWMRSGSGSLLQIRRYEVRGFRRGIRERAGALFDALVKARVAPAVLAQVLLPRRNDEQFHESMLGLAVAIQAPLRRTRAQP